VIKNNKPTVLKKQKSALPLFKTGIKISKIKGRNTIGFKITQYYSTMRFEFI
jgi:hypothetical protein